MNQKFTCCLQNIYCFGADHIDRKGDRNTMFCEFISVLFVILILGLSEILLILCHWLKN